MDEIERKVAEKGRWRFWKSSWSMEEWKWNFGSFTPWCRRVLCVGTHCMRPRPHAHQGDTSCRAVVSRQPQACVRWCTIVGMWRLGRVRPVGPKRIQTGVKPLGQWVPYPTPRCGCRLPRSTKRTHRGRGFTFPHAKTSQILAALSINRQDSQIHTLLFFLVLTLNRERVWSGICTFSNRLFLDGGYKSSVFVNVDMYSLKYLKGNGTTVNWPFLTKVTAISFSRSLKNKLLNLYELTILMLAATGMILLIPAPIIPEK